MLQENYGSSNKVYLSKVVSWDSTGPHARLAFRVFSKLAAQAFIDLNAAKAVPTPNPSLQLAPAPVHGPLAEVGPGSEPGPAHGPNAEPPAKRTRRRASAPGSTCVSEAPLPVSTSLDSPTSAPTRANAYDLDEFHHVSRLGEHCFDTMWRGLRLALKHDEDHEDEISHEVSSSSGLSFCIVSPWHGMGYCVPQRYIFPGPGCEARWWERRLAIADCIALAQAKVRNLMCRATRGRCSLHDSQRKRFFAWACAM